MLKSKFTGSNHETGKRKDYECDKIIRIPPPEKLPSFYRNGASKLEKIRKSQRTYITNCIPILGEREEGAL